MKAVNYGDEHVKGYKHERRFPVDQSQDLYLNVHIKYITRGAGKKHHLPLRTSSSSLEFNGGWHQYVLLYCHLLDCPLPNLLMHCNGMCLFLVFVMTFLENILVVAALNGIIS